MKPEKNNLELREKVLRVISERSFASPITGNAIAERVGSEWRSVAQCVEELRLMGFKIGSSKRKPMGYFLAREPSELRETTARMKQGCLVQLRQLQRMNTWNEREPTIWEGEALHFVAQTIKEAGEMV